MSYESFVWDVKVGECVFVDDGKFVFEVFEINKEDMVRFKIFFGGIFFFNKGVNLFNIKIFLFFFMEKDLVDFEFIFIQLVNWIVFFFVWYFKDFKDLCRCIEVKNYFVKIIFKIEKLEVVEWIDKIIKYFNVIMVVWGDLGIEVVMECLLFIQKDIIVKCIQWA